MPSFLSSLLSPNGFMPHGHCYLWTPGILGLHVGADALTALSYYSIPAALLYFVRRRRDLVFRPIFVLFGIFILACGTTHIMSMITTWYPAYWLEGILKGLTAAASVVTAIAIWPLIPKALRLPSPAQLEQVNAELAEANRKLEQAVKQQGAEIVEIHSQKDQLAAIVASSRDAIIGMDLEGTITSWNDGARHLYGQEAKAVIGRPFAQFVPSESREELTQNLRLVRDGKTVEGTEATRRNVDGKAMVVSQSFTLIRDARESVVGIAAIERDLTQRIAAENEVRQLADELQRSNKELEEFAYIASHDLQAPLRTIVSFAQLLTEDAGDKLSPEAQGDLRYITEAANRMTNLVSDLLLYSRLGHSTIEMTPVAMKECVVVALAALDERIKATQAVVTIDPLPTVEGHETMLTQLMQNLIGNALKFSKSDKHVSVHVTCETDQATGRPIFGIKDQGIGIKAEYFDRIFAPFQRLHTRMEYEGTGIGLAICRKVVEIHRGRIWVESTPEEGSHFRFTLGWTIG